jgi:hypothetical protein
MILRGGEGEDMEMRMLWWRWDMVLKKECGLTVGFLLQIVNPKGEMKGSAITGPVGKEAAELWPVSLLSPPSPPAHTGDAPTPPQTNH